MTIPDVSLVVLKLPFPNSRIELVLIRHQPHRYFDTRSNSTDDPLFGFTNEWRDQTIALWNNGQPERLPSTYVNYAAGYESLESRCGSEQPWRLEKLRQLNSSYDPYNRFAWYNPIIPLNTGYKALRRLQS